jgi:hypothetical protein
VKILVLVGILTLGLYAKTGYLQQTIKSVKNTICIYKYQNSLYAVNIGEKSICKSSYQLNETIK